MPTSIDYELSLMDKIEDYYKKHPLKKFLKRFMGDIYCDEEIQLIIYCNAMGTCIKHTH